MWNASGCTPLDILDVGYSQDPVPTNWYFSFTGASGGATNIHEVDSLKVCTSQGQAVPILDHIRLVHNGQACTGSSNPASITVKACADANCTSLYLGSVTVNLAAIAGATWSSNQVTFSGGQTTVTLTSSTAGPVTLDTASTNPTASNATDCLGGSPSPCSLTFGSCVFDVVETGASAFTPIYTKLSGTAFNLKVLSLSGVSQDVSKVEIVDASTSSTCNGYTSLANSTTAVPSTFSANSNQTFGFTYGGAVRNARIRVITATNQSCSSDNFAIRPQSFTVTSTGPQEASSGTLVFEAGQKPFSLTATTLTRYDGMPKLDASKVSLGDPPNLGSISGSVAFPNATNGVATANGFTYSEVGNFRLGQYAVYDDGFTAVDSNKAQPECTSDFNNGPAVNGKYGCMFGSNAVGPFGRFVPHHFTVIGAVANACTTGNFTYMGQPFNLSRSGDTSKAEVVEARNAGEVVTKNYAAPYAPGTVSFGAENADNGTDLSARLAFYSAGAYTALSGSWVSGVYTLTGNNTFVAFKRLATPPDGPFDSLDLGLTVADSDVSTSPTVSGADMNPTTTGATSLTYKKFSGSPLSMRYGRLILQNAYGPESEDHKMPFLTQYLNNTGQWVTNAQDNSCTALVAANFSFGNYQQQLTDTEMGLGHLDPGRSVLATNMGKGLLYLTKPSGGDGKYVGSVDITALLGTSLPWLQYEWVAPIDYKDNPTGRANFGIYRGNDRIINWREIIR
ncbi:MAG: hypothetical protein NT087_03485 [Deltaproteobacteria bacterium]|nr:hypothetical protein [Deltaproteobacteria bacterium]